MSWSQESRQDYLRSSTESSTYNLIRLIYSATDVKKENNEDWADWDEDDEWDPSNLTVAKVPNDSDDSDEDEASTPPTSPEVEECLGSIPSVMEGKKK